MKHPRFGINKSRGGLPAISGDVPKKELRCVGLVFPLIHSLVTRPGYFLVVAAVLHGVAGLVFNGEITAKTDGL